jgi:hypothetical protein
MNETVKKSNKLTIILIVVLFTSPLLLSWYVFNYTDFLEMRGMSNHGDLIDPPRPLGDIALIDPLNDEREDSLFGKWTLAYVARTCDDQCMENVYRMRQIHIAMDKHSLRVQKALLLTEQSIAELKEKMIDFRGQQVIDTKEINANELLKQFQLDEFDNAIKANRIYIIDPLGNLMMSFKPETNPRDIYKDLKKLLRGSRIG